MSVAKTKPEADGANAAAEWQPKIVAFCCNWCSYAGADLAGTSRLQYPPTVRIVRVPCSGRVNPRFLIRALQRGADGVLVAGCHPGDCHYSTGNYFARRRFLLARRFIEYLGLEPDRLWVKWISGSEGNKFADVVREMSAAVAKLGPNRKVREAR
ncbi:MAG: hydrogenase iron-sulfur subunit [Bacillota bacterium]|nr:hydrogenase iron-sulfur subunit [Bacillota bacterium]